MPEDRKTTPCDCDSCRATCLRKPGWFLAGEATRAAAELGMSLEEFFVKHLARDFFVADYSKDNDGDHSSRRYLLSPAWRGVNGKTVPYTHAGKTGPCSLLGEKGCQLSFEARPYECRITYACQRMTRNDLNEMREHWLQKLPDGERRVLEVLLAAHPHPVPREKIDAATGYARSSRDAYLQRLGSRKLVDESRNGKPVKASDMLFGAA